MTHSNQNPNQNPKPNHSSEVPDLEIPITVQLEFDFPEVTIEHQSGEISMEPVMKKKVEVQQVDLKKNDKGLF